MIDSYILAFPLSAILAATALLCVFLFRSTSAAGFAQSWKCATALMCLAAILTAIEGTWAMEIYHHWTFVILILLILFSLGLTVVSDWKKNTTCGLLCHLGLFLVLFGGLFGSPDETSALMKVYTDTPEHMAVDAKGRIVPLPFDVTLTEFDIESYDDGVSPKQFTSTLTIDGQILQTSVNHPGRYHGYRIYQSGYDVDGGQYSILKIVRDPWLIILALGALSLVAGALLSLRNAWNSWKVLVPAAVLTVIFTAISVARINFGTLMPALRSLWFIPHLTIYMLAYATLALSLIIGVASLFSERFKRSLSHKLLSTASSLLLVGMLCGAVWAQQAWGSYWTWDAKECWAAATWLLTLVATHTPAPRKNLILILIATAFVAMNITWYGVNYLPSSQQSMHTYNQS